jgi:hypothetical protein
LNPKPNIAAVRPEALIQAIRVNLLRRPLWRPETACDCLDISRDQLNAKIQDGSLEYAFELGNSGERSFPRILGLCVVEHKMGPIPGIGPVRSMPLDRIFQLILPARDVRSTELKRILGVGNAVFMDLAKKLEPVRLPATHDGPYSFTTYSHRSVIQLLKKLRIT